MAHDFIQEGASLEVKKVFFKINNLLGPQTENDLRLTIEDVLAAADIGAKEDALSQLRQLFGDSVPDEAIADLLDTIIECKTELVDSLKIDHYVTDLTTIDDSFSLPVQQTVQQCFSTLLTMNTIPRESLPVPQLPLSHLDQYREGTEESRPAVDVATYANHTKYSLSLEAKHLDTQLSIVTALRDLGMDEQLARVYYPILSFNSVQRQTVRPIYHGKNTLVAAPTGAGKTNIAIWAMICLLDTSRKQGSSMARLVVYTAPLKALVREVVTRLETAFSNLPNGYMVTVCEYTGEQSISFAKLEGLLSQSSAISSMVVLVATPEKLDVFTSKLIETEFSMLRTWLTLVLFDEVHLLGDTARGSIIEALVLRFHRHYEDTMILALSATVPNAHEVASFLRCPPENVLVFDSSYRAVTLNLAVCELFYRHSGQAQSRTVRDKFVQDLVFTQLSKGSILIFTHTRYDTERIALQLCSKLNKGEYSKTYAEQAVNKKLYDLLLTQSPILFHHAGLIRTDRQLVEELFETKKVHILVSTATLAWGVNLPAHTVIVIGSKIYSNFQWKDLPVSDILQMAGRAGRPSFDTYGECFIVPSANDAARCLRVFQHAFTIDSSFLSSERAVEKLTRLILTEAFLSTYVLEDEIVQLIDSSFYGIQLRNRFSDRPDYIKYIRDLSGSILSGSCDAGFLRKQCVTDKKVEYYYTNLTELCVKYYISPFTLFVSNKALSKAPIDSLHQALLLVAVSSEYSDVIIRAEEEFELACLENYVPIKYPPLSTRKELSKICTLLQIHISSGECYGATEATFATLSLMSDYLNIVASAPRIAGCLTEIARLHEYSKSQRYLNKLYCMLSVRCWPTFLYAREIIGSPRFKFKSSTPLQTYIKWIEQLEMGQYSNKTLQRLTLENLSQLLTDTKVPTKQPDRNTLIPLFTAITGAPVINSKLILLNRIKHGLYEAIIKVCFTGKQELLRKPHDTFCMHCIIEVKEKALQTIAFDMHLNEEATLTCHFMVNENDWLGRAHIYAENLLFASSVVRLDLVTTRPNAHVLKAREDKSRHITSEEIPQLLTDIRHAIAHIGFTQTPMLIVGHSLYVEQAKHLLRIISYISNYCRERGVKATLIGREGGWGRHIAHKSGLEFIITHDAYTRQCEGDDEYQVVVVPFLNEISEPMGHVLELFLMRAINAERHRPRYLIIAFTVGLAEASLSAMISFLNAQTYVMAVPATTVRSDTPPQSALCISADVLCEKPSIIYDVHETIHIDVDELEINFADPSIVHFILMISKEGGTIYVTGDKHTILPQIILSDHILRSCLAVPNGIFTLIAARSEELAANGFDYIAEQIITRDIPQSYLYYSFSLLPSQYTMYRTMLNYHPKPQANDLAREEDRMLEELSNWISRELIEIEEDAVTLLSPDSSTSSKFNRATLVSLLEAFELLQMSQITSHVGTDQTEKQGQDMRWVRALKHAQYKQHILMFCASKVYANDLLDYILLENISATRLDLKADSAVLIELKRMSEGSEEERKFASIVAIVALLNKVERTSRTETTYIRIKCLLDSAVFKALFTAFY